MFEVVKDTDNDFDIADNEDGDNAKRVSGRFLMWTCFRHLFLVADESNQSTLYAANFGSWFLGFVFARWSSAFRTSLFLMFEVVDDTDGNFNIAVNKDGDDAKKRVLGSWVLSLRVGHQRLG
jgi:hypothetical protein